MPPLPPSAHSLKYSLFYDRPGVRALGTITNGAKATIGIPGAQRSPMHPKAPGRDYGKVHAEVQLWVAAGLLDSGDGGVQADYAAIETKITI
ncbi:hypothetical protein BMS3Abin12_01445 [bacterium BMS3Abin12]|nr:hypothetical protein BMS3Abin12_01445 [bacterium BMS3Abin12]